ncbi:MAG: metabolite traffic protein EboE [Planctomycetaceae bacterium]
MTLSTLPLSYCTNVHPGRTVSEINAGLSRYTAVAREGLSFPVAAGLWLAASVAQELTEDPAALESLAQTLWQHDLCCYTLNTFPYGDFHSERVKERVYLPDWASQSRVNYTEQCAAILAQLLPQGAEGSLSTVPLGGRMNPQSANFRSFCYTNLIRMARTLRSIHESTGRMIRLAIEPEPLCELSGTEQWSLPVFRGLFEHAEALGCEDLVRKYIGLCFDVCHQAVEFEDVAKSIRSFDREGIRICKVHITNAVELLNPSENVAGRQALCRFAEPRYLHQTFARFADGSIQSRLDLQPADIERSPADEFLRAEAWRVHFHVPIFAESLGPLNTTRRDLEAALRQVAQLDYAPHLEVETYTWPVMPGETESVAACVTAGDADPLAARIGRELQSAAELLSEVS